VLPDDLKSLAAPVLAHRIVPASPVEALTRAQRRRAGAGGHHRPAPRAGMTPAPGGPPNKESPQPPTREGGGSSGDAAGRRRRRRRGHQPLLPDVRDDGLPGRGRHRLSELGLAGLRVRRVLPPAIHAGTPYLMGIALENRKRRLPSFSIEVEDLIDGVRSRSAATSSSCPRGGCRRRRTATRWHGADATACRVSGWRTKFPFGLVPRVRAVADVDELYVYPALIPAPEALLRGLPAYPAPGRSAAPSRQGEFHGLRAFRPGDDPRDIHWRSSARRGIPLLREKEDEETREATVILDNAADAADDPAAFERAVSEAAGICVELAHRGFSVGLAVRGGEVRAAVGAAQAERILRALAVIAPDAGALPRDPHRHGRSHPPRRAPRAGDHGGHQLHDPAAGMRFASAHKLVTYLLVLSALAAVASTRVVAPASALLFLAACALSFMVEGETGSPPRWIAPRCWRAWPPSRCSPPSAGACGAAFPIPTSRPPSIWCWPCSPTSCSSGASIATTSRSRR
jgi:hypothetical protein